MCGISGILSWSEIPDRKILEKMNNSLTHRGPDAQGIHVEGALGLAHRRLSVIDLTKAANQPLADGTWLFCFTLYCYIFNNTFILKELV